MPFLTVNSIRLHYELHGRRDPRGAALVLLHGMGSCGDDWALQIPEFARQHRVITADLRGHGESDKPAGRYTVPQMADDVAGLLAALAEPPAHVIGLSLGGCVALQLAISHPAQVRSLALVNCHAKLRPAGWRGLARFALRLWLLAFAPMSASARYIAAGMFPRPEQQALYTAAVMRLSQNPKATYWKTIRALIEFNALPRLSEVRCPALVIAGDRDLTVPLAAKEALHAGLPDSQFYVVADSGHATPLDQPELFNRLILEFIHAHK